MTSRVNLADLLLRGVSLNPREAATLTLAIAREWDRQRSLHGPVALPDIAGIELTDSGTVVFLVVPVTTTADDARALAELLGRLLGVNEDRPQRAIPGGLLIMMSGRLGHLELPSSTLSGFQAALGRFADHDPDALRTVYWRAASRRRLPKPSGTGTTRADRRERRRLGLEVSELRRSLRALERQVFEADSPSASRVHHWRFRYVSGAVAALVLAVMAGAWVVSPARHEMPRSASTVPTSPVQRPVTLTTKRPLAPTPQVVKEAATSAVRYTVSRRPAPRRSRVAQLHDRSSVGLSAGGTRGIAWLIR